MVLSRHLVWSSFPNFASFIMKNDARSDVLHEKNLCQTMKKNMTFLRAGFEPATYGYLILSTTVHRSTNWAIEGFINLVFNNSFILQIQKETSFYSQA